MSSLRKFGIQPKIEQICKLNERERERKERERERKNIYSHKKLTYNEYSNIYYNDLIYVIIKIFIEDNNNNYLLL